jgi:hypothetical protein
MAATTARFDVGSAPIDPRVINGFFPPVSDGIAGYWKTTSAYVSNGKIINLANPAVPGLIVGAPTVQADGALFKAQSNYMNTQIMQSAVETYIVYGHQTVSTEKPGIMGTYSSTPNARGNGIFSDGGVSPAAAVRINAATSADGGTTSSSSSATLSVPDILNDVCLAAVWNGNSAYTLYNLTAGTSTSQSPGANPRYLAAIPIRVGSIAHPSYTGNWFSKRAAYYPRGLTVTELNTMRDYFVADVAAG